MYLPKTYENFTSKFPEVSKAYNQLGISTREAGPLDQKVQDLIKLGIAIGANSRALSCPIRARPWHPALLSKKSPMPSYCP